MNVGDLISLGGGIKNVQRGYYYFEGFSGTGVSQDISINPINPDNSIILVSESSTETNTPNYLLCTGDIIDDTTIRVSRPGGTTDRTYFNWSVVEFSSLKSKQVGEIDLHSSTSYTVGVNEVDSSKSMVFAELKEADRSSAYGLLFRYTLNDHGRSISFYHQPDSYPDKKVKWQLIEF